MEINKFLMKLFAILFLSIDVAMLLAIEYYGGAAFFTVILTWFIVTGDKEYGLQIYKEDGTTLQS